MNKIDLTCVIGQQVLCEFQGFATNAKPNWNDPSDIDFLDGFADDDGYFIASRTQETYRNCRIYQHPDYWIANPNGDLVLPDGLIVESITRDKREYKPIKIGGLGGLELEHVFGGGDIIAVRVTDTAEGWSY